MCPLTSAITISLDVPTEARKNQVLNAEETQSQRQQGFQYVQQLKQCTGIAQPHLQLCSVRICVCTDMYCVCVCDSLKRALSGGVMRRRRYSHIRRHLATTTHRLARTSAVAGAAKAVMYSTHTRTHAGSARQSMNSSSSLCVSSHLFFFPPRPKIALIREPRAPFSCLARISLERSL